MNESEGCINASADNFLDYTCQSSRHLVNWYLPASGLAATASSCIQQTSAVDNMTCFAKNATMQTDIIHKHGTRYTIVFSNSDNM